MTWRADLIFCDDVRQEVTGKHILIGVYSGDLVPAVMPSSIPIAIWIRFQGLSSGRHQFEMRLFEPSGKRRGEISGETDVMSSEAPTVFSVSGLPIDLQHPGDIIVHFGFDGEEPKEIGRLRVTAPPATAQPFDTQSS